ncbi:hypothetical protein DNU06_05275 [Putridiphycobacter roseus]|uniref:O-antigen ligase-related domain-containing protein n=1 Tax=Putridiphycobacter roseus TaxID=2219161 RepID=A0A2W1N390_9FLAO|nr:O-antigen ligase family protein [Putridiphycobacter roseus]PZE18030.1 hypothetical protein DNU06_05275 [Putridiphycobacter roseus]
MIASFKYYNQFIILMVIIYVVGVLATPIVYVLLPIVFILLGRNNMKFELLILTILILILSDYVPLRTATYDSLKFAKDLKIIAPVTLFIVLLVYRSTFKFDTKFIIPFVPFLLFAFVSLVNSIDFTIGFQKTISFIITYLSIPIYIKTLHEESGERFWKGLITFLIGMVIIGIFLGLFIPEIGVLLGDRFKGVLGNPNGLGVFIYLIFVLYTVLKEYGLIKLSKQENNLIYIVLLISLFWCESRNAIMSISLFYATFRLVKVNFVFAILFVVFFLIFESYVFDLLVSVIEFIGLESYFRVHTIEEGSGRKIAWIFAWSQIQEHFFIGGGFGYDESVMRANYYWLERQGHNGGVHNSYLSMWFDTGIIGLFLYFFGLLYNLFSNMKGRYIVLAFIISFLFNINYESWLVGSLNPFTTILLIILSVFIFQLSSPEEKIENSEIEYA